MSLFETTTDTNTYAWFEDDETVGLAWSVDWWDGEHHQISKWKTDMSALTFVEGSSGPSPHNWEYIHNVKIYT